MSMTIKSKVSIKGKVSLGHGEAPPAAAEGDLVIGGGGITDVVITDPGSGYTNPPGVTIDGDGSGAEGEAVLDGNGGVGSVTITDPGSGYTDGTVTFDPPPVPGALVEGWNAGATVSSPTHTMVAEATGLNSPSEFFSLAIGFTDPGFGSKGSLSPTTFSGTEIRAIVGADDGGEMLFEFDMVTGTNNGIWSEIQLEVPGQGTWVVLAANCSFDDSGLATWNRNMADGEGVMWSDSETIKIRIS